MVEYKCVLEKRSDKMAKGNQHFVPRVYLKRWSPQGNQSVFYFEKPDLSIGQPRNVKSILYNRHTYTINFDLYYVLDYMPEIKADFAKQMLAILKNYNVVAFYNGVELNTKELLFEPHNLCSIDKWEFRKKDNLLAPKQKILNSIKEIRSYIIETSLDDFIEKKWNDTLDKFLSEIEIGYKNRIGDEDITVDNSTIEEIVAIMLLFMCRNPKFDCQGIFPSIENVLTGFLINHTAGEIPKENIYQYVNEQIRGAWLCQVYKALFSNDVSYFREFFRKIKERCQIRLLYCPENAGAFITSDNPAFSHINNVTRYNYNAIYFPLTPQYLLVIGNGQPNSLNKIEVKIVNNKGVKSYNKIILSKSYTSIVSNKKYLGYII